MKKIVVTGATSMIGVATINEAIKNNIEVLVILRCKELGIEHICVRILVFMAYMIVLIL